MGANLKKYLNRTISILYKKGHPEYFLVSGKVTGINEEKGLLWGTWARWPLDFFEDEFKILY